MGGFSSSNVSEIKFKGDNFEVASKSIDKTTTYVSSNSISTNSNIEEVDLDDNNSNPKTDSMYSNSTDSHDKADNTNKTEYNQEFLDKYFQRFTDFNNDGKVDNKDLNIIKNIHSNTYEATYDVNGDGKVDSEDISLLKKYLNKEKIDYKDLNTESNKNLDTMVVENSETPSDEEVKETLSNMSEEEYKDYIKDLKNQYDEQIKSYKEYKEQLMKLYKEPMEELRHAIGYEGITGIQYGTPVLDNESILPSVGMNRDDAQRTLNEMQAEIDYVDSIIEDLENKKINCDTYGLIYTKKYIDYECKITDDDKSNVYAYAKVHNNNSSYINEYSYSQYVKKCEEKGIKALNPLQFYECVRNASRSGPLESNEALLKDKDVLSSIYTLKDKCPDYYKTYCYLYDQDPARAEKYLNDIKDDVFKLHGQYLAANQLNTLYEKDGNYDELESIANTLNVSANGIVNGMVKFAEGGVYSLEALAACVGFEGTRQMSAEEYASLYKLYGLMSQENKEKLGLIKKNEKTGKYENASNEFIIDFSKEYSGLFLDKKYQFSEGVGTMLPSIALSAVNPMAATISIGVTSGGNAYHSSMLQGKEKYTSILYGVFTGVSNAFLERKIGGIVGLSNTQVTSLKTYLISIGKETGMGQLSSLMDDLYRASYMGEGFPTTAEEWKDYFEQKKSMAIQSAITAGIMNFPALCTSVYKKRSFNRAMKKYGLDNDGISEALDRLRRANPELADLTDDEIKIRYSNDVARIYSDYRRFKISGIVAAEHVSEEIASVMFHTGLDATAAEDLLNGGSNGIWVAGKGSIKLSNADQWASFTKYLDAGMTEHEALIQMLGDYDKQYASEGWLDVGDIKARVKKAYDSLPESDKKNLSYDEFLKIKLQLVKYDPKVHTPARYAAVKSQMESSGSVKLVWSSKDLNGLLSGNFDNGIGRAATPTQDSATFAVPSSQLDFPADFDSWTPQKKAEYLGTTLGLDSGNFKSGAFEIEIDESIYGDSWSYSDPYTQGSNQEYVPGMYTSSGLSEVIIPRIDDVVIGGIPSRIQKLIKAGSTDAAYKLFFEGIKDGSIKLKPGVTIKQL